MENFAYGEIDKRSFSNPPSLISQDHYFAHTMKAGLLLHVQICDLTWISNSNSE